MSLIFRNVSVSYRGKSIVKNASFSVEQGHITAIVGRNGMGKTTLLRCLTGEKNDYAGEILLNGENIKKLSYAERSVKLSYLPQELPLPQVTVRELVSFGRTPYTPFSGALSQADREKVEWAIKAVGLETFARTSVNTLSGGERKKAFFAMTLAQDTPLVVLDEPTAHLDAESRFAFLELLERLSRETGKTFLVVMHELPEVLQYARNIVALDDGSVCFCGTPEEFLEQGLPQRVFGVQIKGKKDCGYAVVPCKPEVLEE